MTLPLTLRSLASAPVHVHWRTDNLVVLEHDQDSIQISGPTAASGYTRAAIRLRVTHSNPANPNLAALQIITGLFKNPPSDDTTIIWLAQGDLRTFKLGESPGDDVNAYISLESADRADGTNEPAGGGDGDGAGEAPDATGIIMLLAGLGAAALLVGLYMNRRG